MIIPPVELMFDGPPDQFESNGLEYLKIYQEVCHLRPDERILDVGSGIGRKTIPLTTYLSPVGSYEGFDCVLAGVEWCLNNISTNHPNFNFRHIDIRTPGYNPNGSIEPCDFKFPYADNSFDIVVLNSVFTHMLYSDVLHYMQEIKRVLKCGGRCLITWFIHPKSQWIDDFPFEYPYGRVARIDFPEMAIAYDKAFIDELYERAGLPIFRIVRGTWAGLPGLTHQDLILARKNDRFLNSKIRQE